MRIFVSRSRVGSRGRVQGVRTHPPWDEAFFFVLAFKICLPHRSVTSFLRGAPSPNKNPGSAPAKENRDMILTAYRGNSGKFRNNSRFLSINHNCIAWLKKRLTFLKFTKNQYLKFGKSYRMWNLTFITRHGLQQPLQKSTSSTWSYPGAKTLVFCRHRS